MPHFRPLHRFVKYSLIGAIGLATAQLHAAECTPIAQLIALEGMVETKRADRDNWETAQLDESYCPGDTVRTQQESRAALRLANDTLLRLSNNSALTLTDVEEAAPSLLELIRGAIHSISRTPKRMDVGTPYVNASIEGTEFVVSIHNQATDVTVLEGVVVTRNDQGSVTLSADQASHTEIGQAPVKIAIAKPYDAVAWALYYPPLPEQPGSADALAKSAIEALVQNRLEAAAQQAERAIQADPQSAAAYMARSYVDQARFDIPAALEDSQMAAQRAPGSALVQARLAEVHLMSGDLGEARKIAQQAVKLQPSLALAHTVLGFASLRDIDLQQASQSFDAALKLDSEAPLPHLGLGLVKIRQGDLAPGREAIETAVLLDPGNALLRSYLGKAYYEEKRDRLAYQQFTMAKQLDPYDPTAWFYESILLQSDNRPVEALQAQQQAIILNDNRGVYRSRQLLDQDEAARHAALGRIYSDLGFEQQAHLQAIDALAQDPGNHSAHRLLADSYLGITNRDSTRLSELLQAKITQPLSLDPLQPQLSNANLGLLDSAGPENLSYQEYNPLFTRNGMALQLDASVGENSTWSNDAIAAGLTDRLAFSVGQYHSETDLTDNPFDYEQDLVNGFVQFALTNSTTIQIEASNMEEDKGDASQRLVPELSNNDMHTENEVSTTRIGLNQLLPANIKLLLTAIRRNQDTKTAQQTPELVDQNDAERKTGLYESQIQGKANPVVWLAGVSRQIMHDKATYIYDYPEYPGFGDTFSYDDKASQTRLYGYAFYDTNSLLSISGGITLLKEKDESDDDTKKAYPKIGLKLSTENGSAFRLAAFRNRTSVVNASQYETLEPSQIVGFNQLYDDINRTDSWNYGLAYTHRFIENLHIGASAMYRRLTSPLEIYDTSLGESSTQDLKYNDRYSNLWLNWTPSRSWALNIEYDYNRYNFEKAVHSLGEDQTVLAPDGIIKLTTHRLPVALSYFHSSGITTSLSTTYIDQKGSFVDLDGMPHDGEDNGFITDLALSYRFQNRYGSASLGVKNLFDQDLKFEDRSSYDTDDPSTTGSPSLFTAERTVYGTLSLSFR
ncbi:MAG: FecR domain-containing protein [Candidatus Thiodiazotropha sp.]